MSQIIRFLANLIRKPLNLIGFGVEQLANRAPTTNFVIIMSFLNAFLAIYHSFYRQSTMDLMDCPTNCDKEEATMECPPCNNFVNFGQSMREVKPLESLKGHDKAGFLPDYPVSGNPWSDSVKRQRVFCERTFPSVEQYLEAGGIARVSVDMHGWLKQEVDDPTVEEGGQVWPGGDGFLMYVRTINDIVGSSVASSNSWHRSETVALLERLEIKAREIQKKNPELSPKEARARVVMLDVGANQGWFTLAALARGYSTISVEAMPANELLLRSTLCQNAHLGFLDRSIVFPVAVGDVGGDVCTILSVQGDAGNGNVHCGEGLVKDAFNRTLVYRGTARTETLDNLFKNMKLGLAKGKEGSWHNHWKNVEFGAAKIDVEGYEFRAMYGGKSLFRGKDKIPSVLIEYSPDMLKQMSRGDDKFSPHALLDFMEENGYEINQKAFVMDSVGLALGGKTGKEEIYKWEDKVKSGLGAITDIYFQAK